MVNYPAMRTILPLLRTFQSGTQIYAVESLNVEFYLSDETEKFNSSKLRGIKAAAGCNLRLSNSIVM